MAGGMASPETFDSTRYLSFEVGLPEEKKMFGGIGFLLNGNLLVGVRKDSLLVRLGPEQSDEALQEVHVSEFKITGRGTMKGWVVVSLEGVQNDDQLKGWIQRAVKFV